MGRLNSTIINGTLTVNGKAYIRNNLDVSGTVHGNSGFTTDQPGYNELMKIYPEFNSEVNFGGSNALSTIYFGYRAKDSKPIPSSFVFGGSGGSAGLIANNATLVGGLSFNAGGAASGIRFYSAGYEKTWRIFMLPITGAAPGGGAGVALGDVSSWAIRQIVENSTGYGWSWESRSNAGADNPVTMMTLGSNTGRLFVKGDIYAQSSKRVWLAGDLITNAVWNDYAELFEKHDNKDYEAGYIIELDPHTNTYKYSSKANSELLVGVVSDNYGFLLGGEENKTNEENLENFIPIGLAGRVKVWVTGPIRAGDLITSSDIEGVGMKSELKIKGTIIGKALETNPNEDIKKVNVLIMAG
jgi:hypothetical protein